MKTRINFRHVVLLMVLAILSSCYASHKIDKVVVYEKDLPPVAADQVQVEFGKPVGEIPTFQFVFHKEHLHDGLPYPNELEVVKEEGGKMGARTLILDCPSPGNYGSGICTVYGFK